MQHLNDSGFAVHQANGDADTKIVSVALNCAQHGDLPVVVLAFNN